MICRLTFVHCDDSSVTVVRILGRVRCLTEIEIRRQSQVVSPSISYCLLHVRLTD